MFTIVDIVEQCRVPILFSSQQMQIFHMQFDMRLDRVLTTCEALGLHHVQATQSSSSHIVVDLVATQRAPSRTLPKSDFPCVFVGDSEIVLSTCPARAGRHQPHTYSDGCKKATSSSVEKETEKHEQQ